MFNFNRCCFPRMELWVTLIAVWKTLKSNHNWNKTAADVMSLE
jgi:hypothetical protein